MAWSTPRQSWGRGKARSVVKDGELEAQMLTQGDNPFRSETGPKLRDLGFSLALPLAALGQRICHTHLFPSPSSSSLCAQLGCARPRMNVFCSILVGERPWGPRDNRKCLLASSKWARERLAWGGGIALTVVRKGGWKAGRIGRSSDPDPPELVISRWFTQLCHGCIFQF
jgi:hypothetical protein